MSNIRLRTARAACSLKNGVTGATKVKKKTVGLSSKIARNRNSLWALTGNKSTQGPCNAPKLLSPCHWKSPPTAQRWPSSSKENRFVVAPVPQPMLRPLHDKIFRPLAERRIVRGGMRLRRGKNLRARRRDPGRFPQ